MMLFLVDALATYRLTRLVTEDVVSEPVREAVIRAIYRHRDGPSNNTSPFTWSDLALTDVDPPPLAYLLVCRWCASWWVAVLVVCARRLTPGLWAPVADALALSGVTGLLSLTEPA
jgi:hypothetical protein